jgi:hypothetical protein
MNHPYLYPDQAPWTDDYYELRAIRNRKRHDDSYEDDTDTPYFLPLAAATQRSSSNS